MNAVKKRVRSGARSQDETEEIPSSSFSSAEKGGVKLRKKKLSPPTTVELNGISVHFPFRPYGCQKDYMSKVIEALQKGDNALLESPTGTGKTLCLLCAALAWQRHVAALGGLESRTSVGSMDVKRPSVSLDSAATTSDDTNDDSAVPTIIYASRTHSQLSQVVRELRNTRYRPRHAVLGSREQMCVNYTSVKTPQATSSDINNLCSRLNKERRCKFRNRLEGFIAPTNEPGCGSQASDPNADLTGMVNQTQPVLDMEDLVQMGVERKVCPFYFTRGQVADAELLFLPYNYLFERDTRTTALGDVKWRNSIIIFDEAHNLEAIASDSASFDLTSLDIAGSVAELSRAIGFVETMPELGAEKALKFGKLKALLLGFEQYLDQEAREGSSSGEYIFEIFQKAFNLNYNNHTFFVSLCQDVADTILEARLGTADVATDGPPSAAGTPKLDHLSSCIKRVFGAPSEGQSFARARAYRVHITERQDSKNSRNNQGRTLSYWCFAPAIAMHELTGLQTRSIIVTSGTLSPLPSYALELGIPFAQTLENPHIVSARQVHVRVIGKGVSGKLLSSAYERRNDDEYIAELGNTIVSLSKIIPHGVLIFFPSYGVMDSCLERWGGPSPKRRFSSNGKRENQFFQPRGKKSAAGASASRFSFPKEARQVSSGNTNPWKRLLAQKAVVLEPKSSADLKEAIAEFDRFIEDGAGCVLMGVCRGKISEGIDFADDRCRAVIITGLPFPPYLDPKVKLKRDYLDGIRADSSVKASGDGGFDDGYGLPSDGKPSPGFPMCLSGHDWYTQQAHRAVNQAVGRVIRHRADYGAILLLDARFGQKQNQSGLSRWVRPYVQPDQGVGTTIGSLVKFYRDAQKQVDEQKRKEIELSTGRSESVQLRMEDCEEKCRAAMEIDEVEDVSPIEKIAVVSKAAQQNEGTSPSAAKSEVCDQGGSADVVTTPSDTGYIHPNRVLGRLDLKEVLANEKTPSPAKDERESWEKMADEVSATVSSSQLSIRERANCGLQDVYKQPRRKSLVDPKAKISHSSWSGLTKPSQSAAIPRASVSASGGLYSKDKKGSSSRQNGDWAQQFFRLMRSSLVKDDVGAVHRLVLAMKKHGDKKDGAAYVENARELIALLLQYDDAAAETSSDDRVVGCAHQVLSLLFPLLPTRYRGKIEREATHMRFRRSKFARLCNEALPEEDVESIRAVFPILFALRGADTLDSTTQPEQRSFLEAAEKVLSVLGNRMGFKRETQIQILVDAMLLLIPSGQRMHVRTLAKEARTKRLKGMETSRDEAQRRGDGDNDGKVPKHAVSPAGSLAKDGKQSAHLAPQSQTESRVVTGEEDSAATCPTLPQPSLSQGSAEAVSEKSPRMIVSPEETSRSVNVAMDPLESCLTTATGERYEKKSSRDRRIKSNIPDGLRCTICAHTLESPLLANCGHSACSNCWLTWLQKSETCPVCRQGTTKSSLAQIVFEQTQGAGVPSMSQICERK